MAFCHLCLYSLYCSSVMLAAFKADSKSKPMFETKLSTILALPRIFPSSMPFLKPLLSEFVRAGRSLPLSIKN